MEGASDGSALDYGELGQVFESKQRAALVQFVDQFMSDFAVIEVVGIGGDALESAGQLRLLEGFALLIEIAVALEDAFGVRESGEVWVGELVGFLGGEDKAVFG